LLNNKDQEGFKFIVSQGPSKFDSNIDDLGFLEDHNGEKLLWLPASLRGGSIVAPDGTVVIIGISGSLTFVRHGH
jgi:hypothetical protein